MTTVIRRLPDAPVLIASISHSLILADMEAGFVQVRTALDREPKPVFVILILKHWSIDLDDMLAGARDGAIGPVAVLRHPRVRASVIVSHRVWVKAAALAMRIATLGAVRVRVMDTREQALAYCASQLGEPLTELARGVAA